MTTSQQPSPDLDGALPDSAWCPIARSLQLLGDRWTLLIVRDVFMGIRRFNDLQAHLGASRGILAAKLERLVHAGILIRSAYQEPGARPRDEYFLSEAGEQLGPVLAALVAWGNEYAPAAVCH